MAEILTLLPVRVLKSLYNGAYLATIVLLGLRTLIRREETPILGAARAWFPLGIVV
jgi:hypothetical protein